MQPVVAPRPDGGITMLFLPTDLSDLLLGLPAILDSDDRPEVRSRLYPAPSDDEEANADWERLMVPELFALIASARDVMARDLETLELTRDHPVGGRLDIPPEHSSAWISGLNAARLVLGAIHGIDADDMADDAVFLEDGERARAIVLVHLLGELQGVMIEVASRPPYEIDDTRYDADDTPDEPTE